MPNLKKPAKTAKGKQTEEPTASPGDNSPSVTPKDVCAEDASSKDVTERKIASSDAAEREEELLDDAVDMTFPASDPIAIPTPDKNREKGKTQAKTQRYSV